MELSGAGSSIARFMLRRLFIIGLAVCAFAFVSAGTYRPARVPNVQLDSKDRYVSNPDGILSDDAVARIDAVCAELRAKGLAQVAVVAIDDIEGGDVFSFAIELFRSWGVGDARNDNGLGILLVKDLREIRFVTGGGLEGVLPDAICKRIQMQYMLPAFREDDFDLGMTAGVDAVAVVLEKGGEALPELSAADDELTGWEILVILSLFIVLPVAVVWLIYGLSRRCPKCHRMTLRQQSSRLLRETSNFREMEYTYVCSRCGKVVKRRSRNYKDDDSGTAGGGYLGGGLFGGSVRGGSMGGGFGGGSFGGGGAGSKW